MFRAAIISKPQKREVADLLPELVEWLRAHDYEALLDVDTAAYLGLAGIERTELPKSNPSLVIVLGGDGTLLSAARAFAYTKTPILSVNLGSLGFLTEIPLADLYTTLELWCQGVADIDSRAMMNARLLRGGKVLREWDALNDVVVAKGTIARMADYRVGIDEQLVAVFRADGGDRFDADRLDRLQPGGERADRDAERQLHAGDADLPAPADDPADGDAGRVVDHDPGGRRAEPDLPDGGRAGSSRAGARGRGAVPALGEQRAAAAAAAQWLVQCAAEQTEVGRAVEEGFTRMTQKRTD